MKRVIAIVIVCIYSAQSDAICTALTDCADAFLPLGACCYYWSTATVTAGPTDCKQESHKSEFTVSCTSDPQEPGPKTCNPGYTSKAKQRYALSGELGYEDWAGLSADYEDEKTTVMTCLNPDDGQTIGPLTCCPAGEPQPDDAHCCVEYWETVRTTTKQKDLYCKHFTIDFGECDVGKRTGGHKNCTAEGTLRAITSTNCSDCDDELTDCAS